MSITPQGSLWWDTLETPVAARAPLGGDTRRTSRSSVPATRAFGPRTTCRASTRACGSWSLESAVAGFGASGRNGGWCSAFFATSYTRIAKEHGLPAARAMHGAMCAAVDEVGAASAALGIDCHFAKGGTVSAARC